MASFNGFSEGKTRFTPVPAAFFKELLPAIDHLGELKVTVYAIWRLDRMEGAFRYLRRADFAEDRPFMQGLAGASNTAEAALDEALERAVTRGSFLKATCELGSGVESYYFLNSPKGRAAVQAIQNGQWMPSGQAQLPVELISEPPNIYRLYEEHIGPLTPMIADALRDAENTYPAKWIEEAIRIAVENNSRSWRYCAAILNRWQLEGRYDRQDRQDSAKTRRRYAEWEGPGESDG